MSSATTHSLTDAIRSHHRGLADTLDNYTTEVESGIDGLGSADLAQLIDGLNEFLTGELIPHAQGEEKTLYPALDPVIREHGSPTATMSVDHEYIGQYVHSIVETARALRSAGAKERPVLASKLSRLMIQLQGLFSVHLAKEERVYLPLVEKAISSGDQEALLAALHEEAEGGAEDHGHSATPGEELEVRHLPPAQRHQVIFERFNALGEGGSFVLVNDHDPKPLYYQLVAEYPVTLIWEYREQGPEVWRVRMGKAK